MKYMGSKSRHAKEIIPIIMRKHSPNMYYIEPFVGGGNVIDKIPCKKRIGCDSNKYIIALLSKVARGDFDFLDCTIEKDEYDNVRKSSGEFDDALVGWVAHGCSYNGKWFGGLAGTITTKEGNIRNYQDECKRSLIKQSVGLAGVVLHHKSVFDIGTLKGKFTIYCDPPYQGTTEYKDDFNHENFWQWCRDKVTQGHDVYVSEYNAPSDFVCIWEKGVNSSLTKDTGGKRAIERLFVHESQNS